MDSPHGVIYMLRAKSKALLCIYPLCEKHRGSSLGERREGVWHRGLVKYGCCALAGDW